MKPFEFIDHTGDVGVIVYGMTLPDLFRHAAEAFSLILTDIGGVREREERTISVTAEGVEELLVSWLNEFLYRFETEGLLFKRYDVEGMGDFHIKGKAWGEPYVEGRHCIRTVIKAVTYHQLRIERVEDIWKTQIIFDI